jgi:outer membrane protein OmpA-like peptidoglycan-associated protein
VHRDRAGSIRIPAIVALAFAGALLCTQARAQVAMYPGQDVNVNPSVAGGHARILLYPGGKFARLVPPLLQPGAANPGAPIHLHWPVHHHVVAARTLRPQHVATAAPPVASPDVKSAKPDMSPAPQQSVPTPVPQQSAPVAEDSTNTAIPFSFGEPMPSKPAPAKPAQAKPAQANAAPAKPAPKQIASLPPAGTPTPAGKPAAQTGEKTVSLGESAALTKRSEIAFPAGATEPSASTINKLSAVAGDLTAALNSGAARVQLDAYGGPAGDKSSDSRRLSLKRALVVRQLLIEDGVPSDRIDVRAMGGAADGGSKDRVDVFIRAS